MPSRQIVRPINLLLQRIVRFSTRNVITNCGIWEIRIVAQDGRSSVHSIVILHEDFEAHQWQTRWRQKGHRYIES
jgi:hypothetical protein